MKHDVLRRVAVHQALSGLAAIKYGEPTVTQFAESRDA
jgi:hypothetical protein